MRHWLRAIGLGAAALCASALVAVRAAGVETLADPAVDAAPCHAAAAAPDDADRIIALCGALIDNEKTPKPDRIKALIARADAFVRKQMIDRAIADDDVVLRLDPSLADVHNARGELWRRKDDRPRALADFAAAIRLKPDHAAARDNHKALAQELERLGALIAVAGKPSFNCATTRRAVEKAICADPELANQDREIHALHAKALRDAAALPPAARRSLRQARDDFLARRSAEFGRPGYDLRQAMQARLRQLRGGAAD